MSDFTVVVQEQIINVHVVQDEPLQLQLQSGEETSVHVVQENAPALIVANEQGPPGITGINWRDTWDEETIYHFRDAVYYGGSSWYAKQTNVGTPPAESNSWALLSREGNKGETGEPGTGFSWKGEWEGNISYLSNDVVHSNGSSWVALRENIGVQPVLGADWEYLSKKGDLGGDASYIHNQIAAATTWTIQHNLGKYPAITILDTAGTECEMFRHDPDLNTTILTATAPFSGKASCN